MEQIDLPALADDRATKHRLRSIVDRFCGWNLGGWLEECFV